MARAGWYRDKQDPSQARYWDGEKWTGETRLMPAASANPGPLAVPTMEGDGSPASPVKTAENDAGNSLTGDTDPIAPVDVPEPIKSGLGKTDIKYILLGMLAGAAVGLPAAFFVYTYFAGT